MSTLVKPLMVTAVTGAAVTAMRYLSKTSCCDQIMNNQQNQPLEHPSDPDFDKKSESTDGEYIFSDKIIFIPREHTHNAMKNNYILETFESARQLFYYLRWKSNMEAIHGNLLVIPISKTKEILIFNTNLHCKTNNKLIYIIGIKNDKALSTYAKHNRIEQWKMDDYFMTESEITCKYNINVRHLPHSTDTKLNLDFNQLKTHKNKISMNKYADLPVIKTNKVKSDKTNKRFAHSSLLKVSKQQLISEIKNSENFIPIISFNDNKTEYYIDIVLLININNNWIGIIFSAKNNFNPIGIAIDCIDMKNKMHLFKPAKTVNQYQWIQNDINSLYIYNDMSVQSNVKNDEIVKLRKQIELLKQEKESERQQKLVLKQENDRLKNINNFYFQQTFNPNNNIRPHNVHMSNASRTSFDLYKIPANNNVIVFQ